MYISYRTGHVLKLINIPVEQCDQEIKEITASLCLYEHRWTICGSRDIIYKKIRNSPFGLFTFLSLKLLSKLQSSVLLFCLFPCRVTFCSLYIDHQFIYTSILFSLPKRKSSSNMRKKGETIAWKSESPIAGFLPECLLSTLLNGLYCGYLQSIRVLLLLEIPILQSARTSPNRRSVVIVMNKLKLE